MKLAFRIFGFLFGLFAMAGFGLCGILGLSYGATDSNMLNSLTIFGALGITTALVIGALMIVSLIRILQKKNE